MEVQEPAREKLARLLSAIADRASEEAVPTMLPPRPGNAIGSEMRVREIIDEAAADINTYEPLPGCYLRLDPDSEWAARARKAAALASLSLVRAAG